MKLEKKQGKGFAIGLAIGIILYYLINYFYTNLKNMT